MDSDGESYPDGFIPPSDLSIGELINDSDDEFNEYLVERRRNISERQAFMKTHTEAMKELVGSLLPNKATGDEASSSRKSKRKQKQLSSQVPVRRSSRVNKNVHSHTEDMSNVESCNGEDCQPNNADEQYDEPIQLSPINPTKRLVSADYDSDSLSEENTVASVDLQTNYNSILEHTKNDGSPHGNVNANDSMHNFSALSDDLSGSEDKENAPPSKMRRKPQKKSRVIGKIITADNALPRLSSVLHRELKNGNIDRMMLNKEVKAFIQETTGDLYLSRKEWNFLSSALVQKYPILGDTDDPKAYTDIRYKLQNSITSARSYKYNGIPSRSCRSTANESIPSTSQSDVDSSERLITELQQGSTRNTDRVKHLIAQTLQEREKKEESADEKIDKYPHYKNGQLLLYEYALIIKQSLQEIQDRGELFLQNLRIDEKPLEEQLQRLKDIQKELVPQALKNKKIKKIIEYKDAREVHGDISALSSGHEEQAPFLIAIVDTDQQGSRVLSKALAIYKKGVISQLDNPSVTQMLTFLLGLYFVLKLLYPPAYQSFLRLLEKQINGAFSFHTSHTRAKKEYTKFMKNFPVAEQNLFD